MTSEQPPVPPGWYPTPDGQQRYWDGTGWTEQIAPSAGAAEPSSAHGADPTGDERSVAMMAHVLGLFFAILGPLIIYILKKDESPYIRQQSAEALNFGLSMAIYMTVYAAISFVLVFVVIGIFMLFLLPVFALGIAILHIVAAVAANRGESYRYPLSIRFVS